MGETPSIGLKFILGVVLRVLPLPEADPDPDPAESDSSLLARLFLEGDESDGADSSPLAPVSPAFSSCTLSSLSLSFSISKPSSSKDLLKDEAATGKSSCRRGGLSTCSISSP